MEAQPTNHTKDPHAAPHFPPIKAFSVLIVMLVFQLVTHSQLLSISAHSGQVTIPWMINNGKTLFGDVLEQHAPGSSLIAALAQYLLPLEPLAVAQVLNMGIILAITVIIFAVTWQISDRRAFTSVIACLVWIIWEPVYGNVLFYFDTLVGLGLITALLVWWQTVHRHPAWLAPFATGVILGGTTLFKQHAWGAVALFGLWLLLFGPRPALRRTLAGFVAGASILPIALIIGIAWQGNLNAYIYWNWTYNFADYGSYIPYTGDFLRKIIITGMFVPPFWLGALRHPRRAEWLLLGLMWLAGNTTILPNNGEIHMMAQLPTLCVMTALAVVIVWDELYTAFRHSPRHELPLPTLMSTGLLITISILWGLTGVSAYTSNGLSRPPVPAYDEFRPLATTLRSLREPGDTLFVLPETDSTPQLHVASAMLPPGTWIKGWLWYLTPDVIDQLLTEWASDPPDFVVIFPAMLGDGGSEITPLVDFVMDHYEVVATVPDVKFHGNAVIFQVISQP